MMLKRTKDLCAKVEFAIYILCIFLTCAICILLYADGIIRDEYNMFVDGLGLSQNLLILIVFNIIFITAKHLSLHKSIKIIIMVIFIPLFLISSVTIGHNTVAIKNIIRENRFSQTGFNQIHLNDLEALLTEKRTATVYIGREDCPACKDIFPKLEMYLYSNQKSILSYSTIEDREDNLEKLMEVLDALGVDAVPVVLEIEDGIVTEAYFVEDIEKRYIKPSEL